MLPHQGSARRDTCHTGLAGREAVLNTPTTLGNHDSTASLQFSLDKFNRKEEKSSIKFHWLSSKPVISRDSQVSPNIASFELTAWHCDFIGKPPTGAERRGHSEQVVTHLLADTLPPSAPLPFPASLPLGHLPSMSVSIYKTTSFHSQSMLAIFVHSN